MDRRSVSEDFIAAMEEKLQHGREMGRKGWDSHWKHPALADFSLVDLFLKLSEELTELYSEAHPANNGPDGTWKNLDSIRLEAADVANVAMMIADAAGALDDDVTCSIDPVSVEKFNAGMDEVKRVYALLMAEKIALEGSDMEKIPSPLPEAPEPSTAIKGK